MLSSKGQSQQDADAAALSPNADVGDASGMGEFPATATCPCFDGDGTYCVTRAMERAGAEGCVLSLEDGSDPGSGGALLRCQANRWQRAQTCAHGCESGEAGPSDACSLPECACFVRVAWCGASAARHGLGLDPPCRVPLAQDHDSDILGCDGSTWVVKQACPSGCYEAPTGTPDACRAEAGQGSGLNWPDCPRQPLLKGGLHPEASDRLRCAGIAADQISQTIGNAAASAGYHAADGTAEGQSYCAAVDIRTRGRTEAEVRVMLEALGRHGFAVWYRKPGSDGWPADQSAHIHAVFAGVPMKSQLRGQVRDFLVGRNGLSSHAPYRWWTADATILQTVRTLYSRHYTPP